MGVRETRLEPRIEPERRIHAQLWRQGHGRYRVPRVEEAVGEDSVLAAVALISVSALCSRRAQTPGPRTVRKGTSRAGASWKGFARIWRRRFARADVDPDGMIRDTALARSRVSPSARARRGSHVT
jgi:hypothetical protein